MCLAGDIEGIRAAVTTGADINRVPLDSPLIVLAASRCSGQVIDELVRLGADIEATDGFGRGPLHVAAYYGNVSALRALLALGADREALSTTGLTPLASAAIGHRPECEALLANHPQASADSPRQV